MRGLYGLAECPDTAVGLVRMTKECEGYTTTQNFPDNEKDKRA